MLRRVCGAFSAGAGLRDVLVQRASVPPRLRHRSACPHHVSLRPAPGWRDAGAPKHAGWPRTVSQSRRAVPNRSGRLRRMSLHLVLAGRPLRPGRHALCAWPCAFYEGNARGQGPSGRERSSRDACHLVSEAASRRASAAADSRSDVGAAAGGRQRHAMVRPRIPGTAWRTSTHAVVS